MSEPRNQLTRPRSWQALGWDSKIVRAEKAKDAGTLPKSCQKRFVLVHKLVPLEPSEELRNIFFEI